MLKERTDVSQPYVHSKGLLLHLWYKKKPWAEGTWGFVLILNYNTGVPHGKKRPNPSTFKICLREFSKTIFGRRDCAWPDGTLKGAAECTILSKFFKTTLQTTNKIKPQIALVWRYQNAPNSCQRLRKIHKVYSSNPNCSLARPTGQLTLPGCSEEQHHQDRILLEKNAVLENSLVRGVILHNPWELTTKPRLTMSLENECTDMEIFLTPTGRENFCTWY